MRILISPKPSPKYSIGIFLQRVAGELQRRRYQVTSLLFHFTGRTLMPWQQAFIFGNPRHLPTLIASGKPFVITIGRPEIKEEDEALGFSYHLEHQQQEDAMVTTILQAPRIVFISHYVKGVWRDIFSRRNLLFPETRTAVVHHGVDLDQFSPIMKERNEPFVIGMAGQFRRVQGLVALLEISRRLPFPHRLMLVGSMTPEYREVFDDGMKDPKIAACTIHIPWVKQQDLPQYYRRMHCFFHPNIGEPCGIVVAEALACGVPVVCPQYGGPAEFVLPDGGIAVASEPWDYGEGFVEGMERAIIQIHSNWDIYSRGARQQATKYLSIANCVEAYLDIMSLPHSGVRN